jgi:hypothetical protein
LVKTPSTSQRQRQLLDDGITDAQNPTSEPGSTDRFGNLFDAGAPLVTGSSGLTGALPFMTNLGSAALLVDDHVTSAAGNAVMLDTDSSLKPSLSVDATIPSRVTFTVAGLESDYSGTVTFTDSLGVQDVVPIESNGAYSANPFQPCRWNDHLPHEGKRSGG